MNAFSASPFFSFPSRITSVIPAFARQNNSARIHSKDPQTMTKASCKSTVSETTGNVYGTSPATWTSTEVEEGVQYEPLDRVQYYPLGRNHARLLTIKPT